MTMERGHLMTQLDHMKISFFLWLCTSILSYLATESIAATGAIACGLIFLAFTIDVRKERPVLASEIK